MAYSFIAITQKEPDWKEINSTVFNPGSAIEMFPIHSVDKNEFMLGICIPAHKLKMEKNYDTFDKLMETIETLSEKHGFKVFDLYNGFFVDESNYDVVEETLLG